MLSKQQKKEAQIVNEAKGLAKFLSIDLVIKVFGFTILEYHFPPQGDSEIINTQTN